MLIRVLALAALTGSMAGRIADLEQRAEQGDPRAQFSLALLYERGYQGEGNDSLFVVNPDPRKSRSLLDSAAFHGLPEAKNYLGFMLFNEATDSKSPDRDTLMLRGLNLMEEAAMAGDPKASFNLGFLFFQGKRMEKDPEKGVYWLRRASDAGLPQATSMLADIWLEKRVEDPDTLTRRGALLYARGYPRQGVQMLQRADSLGDVRATALLGDAYSRANGVAYDPDKSIRLYLRAARRGFAPAQFIIGELAETFPDIITPELLGEECENTSEGKDANALEAGGIDGWEEGMASASYWLEKAAEGGISDGETAQKQILNPQ